MFICKYITDMPTLHFPVRSNFLLCSLQQRCCSCIAAAGAKLLRAAANAAWSFAATLQLQQFWSYFAAGYHCTCSISEASFQLQQIFAAAAFHHCINIIFVLFNSVQHKFGTRPIIGRLLLHERPDKIQSHFLYGQCSVVFQVPATVDGVTQICTIRAIFILHKFVRKLLPKVINCSGTPFSATDHETGQDYFRQDAT